MIKLISQNGNTTYGIKEYVIDTKAELESEKFYCEMGSKVFIIETQEEYVLNGNGEWVLKKVNTISPPGEDNDNNLHSDYWDVFWDYIQDYGNRTDYSSVFSAQGGHGLFFNQKIFQPKYDLYVSNATNMFAHSLIENLKDLDVILDFSQCLYFTYFCEDCRLLQKVGIIDMSNMISSNLRSMFSGCENLISIDKIILPIGLYPIFYDLFYSCINLQEIRFEGQIARDIDFADCKNLSKESLLNIIDVLRPFNWDIPGQNTPPVLALGTVNQEKLTEEEIQIILDKGWTIA